MKKTSLKRGLFIGVAIMGIAIAVPAFMQVRSTHAEETPTTTTQERQVEPTRSTTEKRNEVTKAAVKERLTDAKLKACQNREKTVTNIMTRLAERGQKQTDLFSTIAERTEKFYTEKGKTLSNYDTLVADVVAKKAAAQAAVDAVKSTQVEFKCDGDNPKGVAATFKQNLKTEIEALKAYKTSVKNLIVGVKSVQGTTASTDGKETN